MNKIINSSIPSDIDLKEDFKQHFYLQLLEIGEDKLLYLEGKGQLEYFCFRIIKNQISKTSPFYKEFRNSGFPISMIPSGESDSDIEMIIDEDYDEDYYINNIKKIEVIEEHLRSLHFLHSGLFRLKFYDGYTYSKLAQSGISFITVKRSIEKTMEEIRIKLKKRNLNVPRKKR